MEYWNHDGYQLATDSWAAVEQKSKMNDSRSDGHNTSNSSDDSMTNVQQGQDIADLWRDHYLSTYDRSLREFCRTNQLDYDDFTAYISYTYSDQQTDEEDSRVKTVNPNDVNEKMFYEIFLLIQFSSRMMMKFINV